jgi:hypothetical protein
MATRPKNTRAMTLRLASEQAEQLERVADIENMPIAEAVRQAISAYIDERRRDPQFQERLKQIIERDREILNRLAAS